MTLCKFKVHNMMICITAAAAAKSLQSCPTLCNPTDGSPPGPAIPGILQARPLTYCKTITTTELANTCIRSHNYHFFFCVVETFKTISLYNFHVYNTVLLTITTTLYIRSTNLIHLATGSLYPLTNSQVVF